LRCPRVGGLNDLRCPRVGGLNDLRCPRVGGLSDLRCPRVGGLSDLRCPRVGGLNNLRCPRVGGLSDLRADGPRRRDGACPGSGGSAWRMFKRFLSLGLNGSFTHNFDISGRRSYELGVFCLSVDRGLLLTWREISRHIVTLFVIS
jgi:hypothetical protein